jgi:hypothetical protein
MTVEQQGGEMGDQRKSRLQKFKVLRFVLIVVSGSMFLLSFAFADSKASYYSISDQTACESLPSGAIWSLPAICTIASDLDLETTDTLTVPVGSSLIIPFIYTLNNDGNLLNDGLLEVFGVLNNYKFIDNSGEFDNYGFVFNYGDIVNDGNIYNEGTFTIGPDGNMEGGGTFEDASVTFCPPGTTFDDSSNLCIAASVYSCPEGTTLDGDKCVADIDKCPGEAELHYDIIDGRWKCMADPGFSCPDNTIFSDGDQCYSAKGCPPENPRDRLMPECQLTPECSDSDYEFRGEDCALGDYFSCPEGSNYKGAFHIPGVVNFEGNCVLDEIPDCPEGGEVHGDYCYNNVVSVECPPETEFDGVTCTAIPECDDGLELFGGVCQVKPTLTCPEGTSLTDITLLCEATPNCPSGYDYKPLTNDCRKSPTCSGGSSYNAVLDLCEKSATKTCSSGSLTSAGYCSYDKGIRESCNSGWTDWGLYCTKNASLSCPSEYQREGSTCYKFASCSAEGIKMDGVCVAELDCPDGTILLPGGICEGTPYWSCEAGSLDATGVWCTADATCPEYTVNDQFSGTCWSVPIDTTCPTGYEFHTLSGKCRRSICPDPYVREFGECRTRRKIPEDIQAPCPKGFTLDWENQECTRGISLELDPCPSSSVFDHDRVLCVADVDTSMFECPGEWELVRKQTFIFSYQFFCERELKCSDGFSANDDGFCEADLQICPDGMNLEGPFCVGETTDKCPDGTEIVTTGPDPLLERCVGDPDYSCPPGTAASGSASEQCYGPRLTQCPPGTFNDNGICRYAPPGTFVTSAASTSYTVCPKSSFCPEASTLPVPCPPGTTSPEGSSSADQCVPDIDGDSINDDSDNCPLAANPDQVDTDGDTLGNQCDADDDNDQQTDTDEITCGSDPLDETSLSPDNDGDFSPDCVDEDDDNDGVLDIVDSCSFEDATGFDADGDGCIDSFSGLADFSGSLASGGAISQNLEDPLIAKVENAEKSDAKGNICTAINQLGAFKNQVEAKRGKSLTDETSDQLIQYADNIITQLLAKLQTGKSCK